MTVDFAGDRRQYLGASDLLQDFIAGCFGGAAQLVSGHPFDTIKVMIAVKAMNEIPVSQRFDMLRDRSSTGKITEPAQASSRGIAYVLRSF